MKSKTRKNLNRTLHASALVPTALLGIGLTLSAPVTQATVVNPDEVIVTARRTKEEVQNVPISITVFNQDMLSERNVTSPSDLAAYTPSLGVNNRFGSDQATFAIRGFTQELRTTASVAVYFADVVAPRGSGNITAGDGAGPGAFFDLQNVQVLKGPQGTLFGRNTTGGAIQLVPQEPTNKLEGYLELSRGNYDMDRAQGVINVPITDSVRARFGIDTMQRDGYLENTTGIGPDELSDVDYLAGRASVIVDVTDSIQNYTIFSQTHSENNGNIQQQFACNPGVGFNALNMCDPALTKQGNDFYNVSSTSPNPKSELKQWQAINTTTFDISDALTVKNILSYADLEQTMRGSIFGTNWYYPGITERPWTYTDAGTYPGMASNSQVTFVEELQVSGKALNEKLRWQAGYYYEDSRPDDWSGSQSAGGIACKLPLGNNPENWECLNPIEFLGNVSRTFYKTDYNNQALYTQGNYDFSDQWRVTLGLRYTVDETNSSAKKVAYSGGSGATFPASITCQQTGDPKTGSCLDRQSTKSEAPTWLIDVDYMPTTDIMVYAKYSRGYRQGSIAAAAPVGFQTYDPEEVDAYEIATKTNFHGPVAGTFNVAVFYNELKEQQLQLGLLPETPTQGSSTTAIVNAGSSTIQGVEMESTLKLTDDLTFNLGYTYLETRLDSANYPNVVGWINSPAAVEGEHLTFSPRHTVVTGLSYRLPLPSEVGDVSAGANYTFTSSQNSSSTDVSAGGSPLAELGARQLLNLNLGWKAIYGSPFDASLFMTNALNEEYHSYVSGLFTTLGAEMGVPGEPKMWGARVKYNFQ